MYDIFDFIQKISSTSFAKFWSMNDIFDFIEQVSFASFPWLLNDIFDFSEKVSSGSFSRLSDSFVFIEKVILHHFPFTKRIRLTQTFTDI